MMRRKWKVGKVLKYFITLFLFLFAFFLCPPSSRVCVFDCSDWQACWDTCLTIWTVCPWCVCVFIYVCVYLLYVCVLADSSALSQSSATEEMPPLLPSPQSSPASKFIHGNQKLYGHPWQGPYTPTHPTTPPLPPWLFVVTGNDVLHLWAPSIWSTKLFWGFPLVLEYCWFISLFLVFFFFLICSGKSRKLLS